MVLREKIPMTRLFRLAMLCLTVLVMPSVLWGCSKGDGSEQGDDEIVLDTKFNKEMLEWHNKARTNPAEFAKTYLKPNITKSAEMRECYNEMIAISPLKPLSLSDDFSCYAQAWANKLGSNGQFEHQKLKPLFKLGATWAAENISAGVRKPKDIVLQLLEDKGVASRGHRKNILSPKATTLGVGHVEGGKAAYGFVTVLDYGEVK